MALPSSPASALAGRPGRRGRDRGDHRRHHPHAGPQGTIQNGTAGDRERQDPGRRRHRAPCRPAPADRRPRQGGHAGPVRLLLAASASSRSTPSREPRTRTLEDDRITAAFNVADALNPRSILIPVNRIEGLTRAVAAPSPGKSLIAGQGAIIDLGGPGTRGLPGALARRHVRRARRGRSRPRGRRRGRRHPPPARSLPGRPRLRRQPQGLRAGRPARLRPLAARPRSPDAGGARASCRWSSGSTGRATSRPPCAWPRTTSSS